ncbi:MAG: leucine-rich repeat protein, partial [Oscillospiraceae bacterium]|nr:leucine-rich repeat protein [Oscillospiraceae bacterium]
MISVLPVVEASATSVVASGECGTSVNWELVDTDADNTGDKLVISGTGEMYDYKYDAASPWSTYKDSINTIVVHDGATTIGDYAFYECKKVTNISIPFGVSDIGECAFNGCSLLTGIAIPNSVKRLGNLAFSGTGLTNITIPDSVTEVGEYLFGGCGSLKEVTVPGSIKDMNKFMFFSCDSLEKVVVSDGVEIIGNSTFEVCSKLTDITLPESLKSIGKYAFSACTELKSIKFAGSKSQWVDIEKIEQWDYMMEEYQVSYGKYDITVIQPENGTVTVDKTVAAVGETVTVAATPADRYKLKAVYVDGVEISGNTFTVIADHTVAAEFIENIVAEGECGTNVTWTLTDTDNDGTGDTLTISGSGAMDDYDSGSSPWYDNRELINTIIVEEGVTYIGDWAFYDLDNFTCVQMPNSLIEIGEYVFESCYKLREIHFPKNIEIIPGSVFGTSTIIENITVDAENKTFFVEDGILYRNYDDGSVIYVRASASCASNSFMIGKGPCGDRVTWFKNNYGLRNVIISGQGAMADYESYEDTRWYKHGPPVVGVTVEEGVTYIGTNSFGGLTSMSVVDIPESMTAIGENAFANCAALTDVYYAGSPSQWENINIADGNESLTNATIHFAKSDYIAEGQCGDNLTWTISENNVLEISGTGEMYDYETGTYPWKDYVDNSLFLELGNGIAHIGNYAFADMKIVGSVTIPESVTTIGDFTFSNLPDVTGNLVIPDSVTAIGQGAFNGWGTTGTLKLSESLTEIGEGIFNNCNFTGELTIPSGVKTIGTAAFSSNNFSKVTLNSGLEKIDIVAFSDCSQITEITIPESITEIAATAFMNCGNISKVNYEGSKNQWNNISIGDTNYALLNATINYGKYDITVTKPENGTVTVDKTIVTAEETVTVIVTSAEGYVLDKILVNGIAVAGNTFTATADSTVTAEFKEAESANIEINIDNSTGDTNATVTAPEGDWKEGTNTFTVSAEKPCVVAVSYDGGLTYVRVTATATGT